MEMCLSSPQMQTGWHLPWKESGLWPAQDQQKGSLVSEWQTTGRQEAEPWHSLRGLGILMPLPTQT